MNHSELISLIRDGVPNHTHQSETWADFGAGRGNFTIALNDLLDNQATLIAIDRDANDLDYLSRRHSNHKIQTLNADFTAPLDLPPLDGILMANALHFIRAKNQAEVLRQIVSYLKTGGTFIIVEYELHTYRPWIPHPVPFSRFQELAAQVGLVDVRKVGNRQSPTRGDNMYGAAATKQSGA
jgi:ubiquinone/menaquinone biosynthesis C-methylase UbiE